MKLALTSLLIGSAAAFAPSKTSSVSGILILENSDGDMIAPVCRWVSKRVLMSFFLSSFVGRREARLP
jgi:hypothetical protein